jgi:hypothetical protein
MLTSPLTILVLTTVSLLGQPVSSAQSDDGRLVTKRIEDRIVKTFDFDERKLGNYEDLPMNWNKITGSGHPWFLAPSFDDQAGHFAPPSFRLAIKGGSLGAEYVAKNIPVHPSSDYRITAWIRPEGLSHAGARLTAYFVDHALRKIKESERRTRVVRGPGPEEPWAPVSIELPAGFENAAWIGLSCLVEQPETIPSTPGRPRPIDYRDAHGVAWFDDITIFRLPRAEVEFTAPGNVFFDDQPIECRARVADPDGAGLVARLEILDADHHILQTYPVPIVDVGADGALIPIGDLPAGMYIARLSVNVGLGEILTKQRAFIRLNPDVKNSADSRRGFGLSLGPSAQTPTRVSRHLLEALSPDMVKVPLWSSDTDDEAIVRGDPRLGALLHALQELGITVVATLEAPPLSFGKQTGKSRPTLLDLLTSPPDQWRPYLALMLTRYGPRIWAWQVGAERGEMTLDDRRLPSAIAAVRAELQPLIGSPDLVVPLSVQIQPNPEAVPADILSLVVPAHISAGRFLQQLEAFKQPGLPRLWATIRLPDADRYDRRARLVEFARRIIIARHGGIETVFAEQPWTAEAEGSDVVVTPHEALIVFRTLAQTLGGLEPVMPVWIDHGLIAWLFADQTTNTGALVTWTEAEGTAPRQVVADVGPEAKQIDLWANVTDTVPADGGREFVVDAMPTVIAPAAIWRIRVLAGFAVQEPEFQVAVEEHERIIVLANPLAARLRGTLRLEAPSGWRVRPRKIEIDVAGGQTARLEVVFRIPNNQATGDYTLIGHLDTVDRDLGNLMLRAPLQVSSPGLDVSVMTSLTGRRLDIVQRITNRTDESLNLRTFMVAPQVSFDTRHIANLAAGQTAVRHYRIEDARLLAGRHIRVSTQQIGGPLKHNQVIGFD